MTKIFRDLTRKFVGLNIKKSVLTTKMRVFDYKNMYLTMKLESVLTTKIVDNFVRFGMLYSYSHTSCIASLGMRLQSYIMCSKSGNEATVIHHV